MAAKTKALRLLLASTSSSLLLPLSCFNSLSLSLSFMRSHTQLSISSITLVCSWEQITDCVSLSFFVSQLPALSTSLSHSTSLFLSFPTLSLYFSLSLFVLFPPFSLGLLPFRAVTCTTMRMLNISKCCAFSWVSLFASDCAWVCLCMPVYACLYLCVCLCLCVCVC